MKENILPVLIAITLSLILLGVVAMIAPKPPINPTIVSCIALDADPVFYTGALVQIPTSGMQTTSNTNELVFRKLSDKPPIVLCRFSKLVPEPMPKYIIGICQGRHGDTVLVVECITK